MKVVYDYISAVIVDVKEAVGDLKDKVVGNDKNDSKNDSDGEKKEKDHKMQ